MTDTTNARQTEGRPVKRRRPLGLGQSAAIKKEAVDPEAKKKHQIDSEVISADSKKVDDQDPVFLNDEEIALIEQAQGDEMEELESLYDAALLKLIESGSASKDSALLLFRGVIHECDKLVRQVYENEDEESKARLKPTFYLVYGNALYRSGILGEKENYDDFLRAAMYQFEIGLEKWKNYPKEKNLGSLYEAAAFVLLHQASDLVFLGTEKSLMESQKVALKAMGYIQIASKMTANEKGLVESALALQKYGDLRDDESGRMEWNQRAIEILEEITETEGNECKNVNAFTGLGNAFLSQANYFSDQAQDEDQVSIDMIRSEELLGKAQAAFEKGLGLDPSHAPTLASLGETFIYLGNLADAMDDDAVEGNESKSSPFYRQAMDSFRRCQVSDPGALPEQFLEFMLEFEAEQKGR